MPLDEGYEASEASRRSVAADSMSGLDLPTWIVEDARSVKLHPQFQAALRLYAGLVCDGFEKTTSLIRVVSEEARYWICVAAMAMHYCRDAQDPSSGCTLTRVQDFATKFDLAGPKRVAALMMLMNHLGYNRQVVSPLDRRVKRFELTDRGAAIADEFMLATLRPIQLLSDTHDYIQILRDDPDFSGRYHSEGLRLYAEGVRSITVIVGSDIFAKQDAGREVMHKLWIAFTDKGPTERAVVSCPYGYLARAFSVSRGHVRRIIEKGAERGFFVLHAPGGQAIEILPRFVELYETLGALEFAAMRRSANIAASTRGKAVRIGW